MTDIVFVFYISIRLYVSCCFYVSCFFMPQVASHHLKNEFDFCKVHGIMNTSGLLHSIFCKVHLIMNTSGLLQSK